ncbi:MAG: TRAM domain-containing protein [Oscillospiraceae bacterium]|nr:TRAM domain-containing protein [Oscillospiraceae bacterium]
MGRTFRVLGDGETGAAPYNLSSRTDGGRLVHLRGDPSLVGRFVNVRITGSTTWALYGELV